MKTLLLLFSLSLLCHPKMNAQNEFELEPSQSMLMTGKGPGQDGTLNPYDGQDCFAIIENFGKKEFSIRIQQKGNILETITIFEDETKRVKLLKGQELYLDSNSNRKVNARVSYEKIRQD